MIESSAPAVVLDTNVVLDWLVFRDPRVAPLGEALQTGAVRWLATPPMREELAHMLVHKSLVRWEPDAERALTVLDSLVVPCNPAPPSRLHCTDPDDQGFIDLAIAQHATWLITHDRALLKLARRARDHGVAVLTPAAWCTLWPKA